MSVAVVTGAASGMGRACIDRVRALPGVDTVLVADLRDPQIPGTVGVACDVSDAKAVRQLADTAAAHGSLRALVHAAGLSPTMADGRRIMEVNLVGTHLLLDAFDDHVVEGTAGVCLASTAAYMFGPFLDAEHSGALTPPYGPDLLERVAPMASDPAMAYGMSKVGVQRLVAFAALSWGRRGARLNSVSPGIIDTPMGRQELAQQPLMQPMLEQVSLGRMGRAEEIAGVVAFLLSDDASYVNGIDILADGGSPRVGAGQ